MTAEFAEALAELRALVTARVEARLMELFRRGQPSHRELHETVNSEVMRVDFVIGASPYLRIEMTDPRIALKAVEGMDC